MKLHSAARFGYDTAEISKDAEKRQARGRKGVTLVGQKGSTEHSPASHRP